MAELALILPLPIGTLNVAERRWTTGMLTSRSQQSIQTDPATYWGDFAPVFSAMERDSKTAIQTTAATSQRQMFSWTSGGSECTKTEYSCDAYTFEAIMAISAMAAYLWNEVNAEGRVPLEIRREHLARSAGMYEYISTKLLSQWRALPPANRCAAECQRMFVEGMKRMCLGRRGYISIMTTLSKQEEEGAAPEQLTELYSVLMGAAETFAQAAAMFRGSDQISSQIIAYADRMHAECYVKVILWQIKILETSENGHAGVISSFLGKRLLEQKTNEIIRKELAAQKTIYDSSCSSMGLELKDPMSVPVCAPKRPTMFTPFEIDVKSESDRLKEVMTRVLAAWKEGYGLENATDRATLASLLKF